MKDLNLNYHKAKSPTSLINLRWFKIVNILFLIGLAVLGILEF